MRCFKTILLIVLLSSWLPLALAQEGVLQEETPLDVAPDEMQSNVVKVLRTSNKAQINRYVCKVYDFKNVNPGEIVNFFTYSTLREEGGVYTFVNPEGTGGKILVICPRYQLPYLDELAQQLDRPKLTSAPGSRYIYYHLRHRSAADPDFINLVLAYISPMNYQANAVPPRPLGFPNPGHYVQADIETNSVLLFDSPSGSDYAKEVLEKFLDAPTPEVKVQLKIYEVAVSNDGTIGLDFESWKNGPGRYLFWGFYSRGKVKIMDPRDFNFRHEFRGAGAFLDYPSAYFDFLVEKGKAKVLVDTRLTACNHTPALIYTGEEILYFQEVHDPFTLDRSVTQQSTPRAAPGEPRLDLAAADAGIYFMVEPIIGTMSSDLYVDAQVVNLLGFDETGAPLLASRSLTDEFRIENDKEILVGGLMRETKIRNTQKIPFLGSLPVLGWLFGKETDIMQRSLLMMVIKPTLVTDYSGMTASEREHIERAKGQRPTPLPKTEIGFDQFLFTQN